VLENEWTLLVGMAGKANGILRCRGTHLLRAHGSMRVVAIGAFHKPFVHAMVKGHFKLGFLLYMAAVAQLRLRLNQKEFFCFRVVWRMAGDATHVVLGMQRIDRIHVLRAADMARHAAAIDFFRRSIFEGEDL
jgi:hypothetical protein